MSSSLQDKVVVITGASSGIGRATALACAREGASVVVSARKEEALRSLAKECEQAGGRAIAYPADVTDQDAMYGLAQETIGRFGRIDVWFNNAAVTVGGRFEEVPADVYQRVIETNLFGTINGSRAVIPYFREQGNGILINHASVLGKFGASHFSAYSASKFGVIGFSESIRQELRDADIHVCVLMPAAIDTPLYNQAANYSGRGIKPVQPVYSAERVADTVLSLIKKPRREAIVGNAGRAAAVAREVTPFAVSDRMIGKQWETDHFKPEPADPSAGNVFEPDPKYTDISGGWQTSEEGKGAYLATGVAAAAIPAAYIIRRRLKSDENDRRKRFQGGVRQGKRLASRAREGAKAGGSRFKLW
jgi:NAD(P)-dependent dehydrogenase (short-subunit alcohol dehydrogenase family)